MESNSQDSYSAALAAKQLKQYEAFRAAIQEALRNFGLQQVTFLHGENELQGKSVEAETGDQQGVVLGDEGEGVGVGVGVEKAVGCVEGKEVQSNVQTKEDGAMEEDAQVVAFLEELDKEGLLSNSDNNKMDTDDAKSSDNSNKILSQEENEPQKQTTTITDNAAPNLIPQQQSTTPLDNPENDPKIISQGVENLENNEDTTQQKNSPDTGELQVQEEEKDDEDEEEEEDIDMFAENFENIENNQNAVLDENQKDVEEGNEDQEDKQWQQQQQQQQQKQGGVEDASQKIKNQDELLLQSQSILGEIRSKVGVMLENMPVVVQYYIEVQCLQLAWENLRVLGDTKFCDYLSSKLQLVQASLPEAINQAQSILSEIPQPPQQPNIQQQNTSQPEQNQIKQQNQQVSVLVGLDTYHEGDETDEEEGELKKSDSLDSDLAEYISIAQPQPQPQPSDDQINSAETKLQGQSEDANTGSNSKNEDDNQLVNGSIMEKSSKKSVQQRSTRFDIKGEKVNEKNVGNDESEKIGSKRPSDQVDQSQSTAVVAKKSKVDKKTQLMFQRWDNVKKSIKEEKEKPSSQEKQAQEKAEEWRLSQLRTGKSDGNTNFTPLSTTRKVQPPDLEALSADLPSGWKAMWDANTQRVYYGNLTTREVSWYPPQ